ncbi:MAG: hypothetical protein A3K18_25780 [Lentisphaerae bacterium RIFOXYA12_64_32]|nr:MAG: hypothetical protein A3K18_25780 [Lentisphaerae bacterium RIFOXYA12_64_32]
MFTGLNLSLTPASQNTILDYLNLGYTVTFPRDPVTWGGLTRDPLLVVDPVTGDNGLFLVAPGYADNLVSGSEVLLTTPHLTVPELLAVTAPATPPVLCQTAADWLTVLPDSTISTGIAYLPAIAHIKNFLLASGATGVEPPSAVTSGTGGGGAGAGSGSNTGGTGGTSSPGGGTGAAPLYLSSLKVAAAAIALIGRIDQISAQPAIVNVQSGPHTFSPNADNVQDTFNLAAACPKTASWTVRFNDAQGNQVRVLDPSDNLAPNTDNASVVNLAWDGRDDLGTLLPDGRYGYTLAATGPGGTASVSNFVVLDNTPPQATIAVTSRTSGGNTAFTFTGTASDANFESYLLDAVDAGTGAKVQTLFIGNMPVSGSFGVIPSTALPNGTYRAELGVLDKAGNFSTAQSAQFTVNNIVPDTTPPAITVTSTLTDPNAGTHSGAVPVTVTATDAGGIASIELLLDGATVAQTVASPLSYSLDCSSLSDGPHTLYAVAADNAGNLAETESYIFLTSSPISGFAVTPSVATQSQPTLTISATLKQPAAWTLSFTGNDAIANITGNDATISAPLAATGHPDGDYTVTLTVAGLTETPQRGFAIDLVNFPPVADVANLANGAPNYDGTVTPVFVRDGLLELTGTANDPDADDTVSYNVTLYKPDGTFVAEVFPSFRTSPGSMDWRTARVNAGALGTADLSLVENGVYDLVLTVRGGSESATDQVRIALDSPLKVGQFGFSAQDLIIPVSGLPLTVIRTYSSLNPRKGDFGWGWTYSISDVEVELNEERGTAFDENGDPFEMRTGGARDVTITLPDGRRTTFTFSIRRGSLRAWAEWTAAPGVYATLVPTCSNEIEFFPMAYWYAGDPRLPLESFDFPGFILTMKDGTKYFIDREDAGHYFQFDEDSGESFPVQTYGKATLTCIQDRAGNTVSFSRDSERQIRRVDHFNASGAKTKSVVFQRNGEGLISAVFAPDRLDGAGNPIGPASVTYDYDGAGNLWKVSKLVEQGGPGVPPTYQIVEFRYENVAYPHYITSIVDPRGVTPMRTEFDASGRIIATIDAYGHRIDFGHDLAARSETVYDRLGNPTIHIYDVQGNVTDTIDAQGNVTRRTYDAAGNELSVTDPLGYTTNCAYDSQGNRTSVTDPLGNTTRFSFDGNAKVTAITNPLGHTTRFNRDAAGKPTSRIDPFGRSTMYQYDANGQLAGYTAPDGTVHLNDLTNFPERLGLSVVSPAGEPLVNWEEQFDGTGRLLARTATRSLPDGTSTQLRMDFTYDAAGRPLRVANDMGLAVSYEYNEIGQCVSETGPTGQTTEYEYDLCGRPTRMIMPDGKDVAYVYDANGRPVQVKAGGLTTCNTYDSLGRTVRITRNQGTAVEESTWYSYDVCGRVIEERSTEHWRRYEYDACGRVVRESDWTGASTETVYDAAGRAVKVKLGENAWAAIEYDSAGRRTGTSSTTGAWTDTEYDVSGRPVRETGSDGTVNEREFDALGNLTCVDMKGANSTRKWFEVRMEYDELGHMSRRTDALGRTTTFTYDNAGRLLSETRPDGGTRSYEYAGARLAKQIDFDGRETVFGYDSLGRLATTEVTAQGGGTPLAKEYRYDTEGRLSEIHEARGISLIGYDSFGRVTSRLDPVTGTVWYDWDAWGRCRSVHTATHRVDYTYDEFGRVVAISSGTDTATIAYGANGLSESVTYPNGVTRLYDYDLASRAARVVYADSQTGTEIARFAAEYDTVGRCVRTTSGDGLMGTFAYNEIGMLSSEVWENTAQGFRRESAYEYDACGNRTRLVRDGETLDYTYAGNGDRLLAIDSNVAGRTEFEYDDYGALTLARSPDGTQRNMTYDLDRRLTGWSQSGGQAGALSVAWAYDVWGNRVAETVSDQAGTISDRRFRFDTVTGAVPFRFEEYDNAGGNGAGHVRGPGGMLWTRGLPTGTAEYYLPDTFRNVRRVLDGTGNETARESFDAFGNPLPGAVIPNSGFGYRGEVQDARTGLVHLRAREYLPEQGRFNAPDPLDGDPTDPMSLHRYAYAANDPVQYSDPTGMFTLVELTAVSAIQQELMLQELGAARQVRGLARVTLEKAVASQMYQMVLGLEPEHSNASLVVHGIMPDGTDFGWSAGFTAALDNMGVKNQDFVEFRWTGFQFGTALGTEFFYALAMAAFSPSDAGACFFGITLQNLDRIDAIATESLTRTMDIVQAQGYANVNVLSHSWGTFLSHRMLYRSAAPVTEWFTFGSPLGANAALNQRPGGIKQWHNVYSLLDLVCVVCPGVATALHVRGGTGDSGGGQLYTVAAVPSVTVDSQLDINGGAVAPPSSWLLPGYVDISVAQHQSYWVNLLLLNAMHGQLKAQPK